MIMELVETIKNGLEAGMPVGIACAAIVAMLVYAGVYKQADMSVPKLAALWIGISLFIGILAVWVYGYVTSSWSWGAHEYLILALGLALALSVLAFLPLYGTGKGHVLAVPYTILNFVDAIGFSLIIPRLIS
jgi:hypothetical protein